MKRSKVIDRDRLPRININASLLKDTLLACLLFKVRTGISGVKAMLGMMNV